MHLLERLITVIFLLSGFVIGVAGCGSVNHGHGFFSDESFHHGEQLYSVDRIVAGGGFLRGASWYPWNYTSQKKGARPNSKAATSSFDMDRNSDGVVDYTITVPDFDLRLVNKRDDGVAWLRSVPLDASETGRSLGVIVDRLIANASGSIGLQYFGEPSISASKRFGVKVVDRSDADLSGVDAHRVVMDVVDLDAKDAGDSMANAGVVFRVELQLARLPMRWPPELDPSAVRPYSRREVQFVFVAGYRNSPTLFDASQEHFREMLSRVRFKMP